MLQELTSADTVKMQFCLPDHIWVGRFFTFAVASGRERIVEQLLSMEDHQREIKQLLRMQDKQGYTALALATELTDNTDVAERMIDKGGTDLLTIKTKGEGGIPILIAAAKGHKRMTRYLFSQIPFNDEFMSGDDYRVLLDRCISAEIFDVACTLLLLLQGLESPLRHYKYGNERHPLMALARMPSAFRSGAQLGWWNRFIYNSLRLQTRLLNRVQLIEIVSHDQPADKETDTDTLANLRTTYSLGRICRSVVSALVPVKSLRRRFGQCLASVLRILPGSEKIYEMKENHYLVLRILRVVSEPIWKYEDTDRRMPPAYDVMLLAAKYGVIEVIDSVSRANPNLLRDDATTVLGQAICHRQEKVFQHILGMQGLLKAILISQLGYDGNNLLHLAAELGHSSYLNRLSNPALQIQRELQWFKEVEKIVPPRYKQAINNQGMTPHELFNKKQQGLMKAGEQWARDTASSFTLVGTLIVTIMFAAAFIVPGGNDQNTGMPIFLKRREFLVFIIADTISLIMSSSSVLIFIEILTLRYAMSDFLKSLRKILLGLFTLFFSVTSMMLTFVAALSLMLKEYPGAIVAASSLAMIPVLVLIHTLVRLSYEILKSATWTPERG